MEQEKPEPPGKRNRWQRLKPYLEPGQGVFFLMAIHLVAFVFVYLGLIKLVEREVAYAHGAEVRDTFVRLVGSIHSELADGSLDQKRQAIANAQLKESLISLDFLYPDGSSVMGGEGPVGTIASHSPEEAGVRSLRVNEIGDLWTLSGQVPIRASQHCGPCHEAGTYLGSGSLEIDITQRIAIPRARLQKNAAKLVFIWILGLGVLNVSARWIATRRFRRFRKDLEDADSSVAEHLPSVVGSPLDRVSTEMYDSLYRALRQVAEREERVAARIHHTERLASLGQIAAGLAHEIKNPLAGIRGALELMRDDEEVDEGRQQLYQQMIGEMDRVHGILHSLLRFARPSPPHKVPTEVRSMVEECVGLMAHGLRRKGIHLTSEVAENVGAFSIDAAQIRQVIVNLINNAGEAIGKDGKIVLRVSTYPEGQGLILAVEDDGPGMDEEALSRVFQPFFTTKFSGTGLGLAVSRSIILKHGGSMEVQSNPGEGATFFVLFPESAETAAPDHEQNAEETA